MMPFGRQWTVWPSSVVTFLALTGMLSGSSGAAPSFPPPTPTPFCPEGVYRNPSPEEGDRFGAAISGGVAGYVIVGVPGADSGGVSDSGEAHLLLLDRSDPYLAILPNPDPGPGDAFGSSVRLEFAGLIDVLVGAPFDDPGGVTDSGSVYVYDLTPTGGAYRLTLNNPIPYPGAKFGFAIDGSSLDRSALIGAPGIAHVWLVNTLTGVPWQNYTLACPGGGTGFDQTSGFGEAVHLNFNSVVIGRPRQWASGILAVYPETGMAWIHPFFYPASPGCNSLLSAISANNPEARAYDHFGSAVAADDIGEYVYVGAPDADIDGITDAGVIYVFSGYDGTHIHTIRNPFPSPGDRFGARIAAQRPGSLGSMLVGVPGADFGAPDAGVVYYYDSLELLMTILNPDPQPGDHFGEAVSFHQQIMIGAPDADVDGIEDAGIAYWFHVNTVCPSPTPQPTGTPAPTPSPKPAISPSPTPNAASKWTLYE